MSGPPMKGPYDPDRIRERVAAASMSDPTQAREALVEEVRVMLDTHACFQTDPPLIGVIELRRRLAALARMHATPFGSLTLLGGVVVSRGQARHES